MARYPDLQGSQPFTVETLRPMIYDYYTKGNTTDRITNAVTDDPDLAGIPLGVGTWHVKSFMYWSTNSGSSDFRCSWGFTGTWNNPNRVCIGPSTSNTSASNAVSDLRMSGTLAGTLASYGGGIGGLTNIYVSTEESVDIQVTVAGNLSLAWAQNTLDAANATRLFAGSWFRIKQLA